MTTCGEAPPRRWPLYALFGVAVLAGMAMWAYAPSLRPETLIARYTNDRSRFVDEHDRDGLPSRRALRLRDAAPCAYLLEV